MQCSSQVNAWGASGTVSVSNGLVFAYGTAIAGDVIDAAAGYTVSGAGVAIAWDEFTSAYAYFEGDSNDLDVEPATASATWSINGADHGIAYANGANTGFIPLGVTVITPVSLSAISGVTQPVAGAAPVTSITETAQYTGAVSWNPNHNPFNNATAYTATITLTPKPGFVFAGIAANFFTVAGATSVSNVANSGIITAVFPATSGAPPNITGPATMTLSAGYTATSTGAYTITGTTPVTVVKSSGDALITWNNATKRLDIAEGLAAGVYEVRLRAANSVSSCTFVFTLTVKPIVFYLNIPQTFDGGSVAAQTTNTGNPYIAEAGDRVTLIVTPNSGYRLDKIFVYMLDGNLNVVRSIAIPLSGTGNTLTFTMPAHHVTVEATFSSTTVGIDDVDAGNTPLRAYAQSGVLYVNGLTAGQKFSIYNIVGTSVYQGIANSDKAEVALPIRGVYVVTDGKNVVKVVN